MNPLSSACGKILSTTITVTVAAAIVLMPVAKAGIHTLSTQHPVKAVVLNQTEVNGVPMAPAVAAPPPDIVSEAAVVMDMKTGTIVYAKHALDRHYPASITKILTAMLALQHGRLTDLLAASPHAVDQPPDKLYLVPGEQEPLKKLLYGLLLISANDAAVVIAEHYGRSVGGFAQMMNEEAVRLGAVHSHFVNPNGLPDPNHFTTAYDMAVIARAAMDFPEFRRIVSTKYYEWHGTHWQSSLMNINKMLFIYPGAIGIKTGYTSVAHETLAVAATHGDQTLLAILMDAPTNYAIRHDATSILNYSFANYRTQTLLKQGTPVGYITIAKGKRLPVAVSTNVMATIPTGQPLKTRDVILSNPLAHSVKKGAVVGSLQLLAGQQVLSAIPIVALRSYVSSDDTAHPTNRFDIVLLCLILGIVGVMSFRVFEKSRLNS